MGITESTTIFKGMIPYAEIIMDMRGFGGITKDIEESSGISIDLQGYS